MGKFERIRNIRQRRKRELQIRPGRVQRFFTAVLSVITAGCIPKQRRFNVPFSFENPVYGSQAIDDIVGLTNSNATNSTQDKQVKQGAANSQRSYSCTHVTNLQREQKKPGAQWTEKITKDKQNFSTDVEKTASQPETQAHPLFAPVVDNGSCKDNSSEVNGDGNARKFFTGNDSASVSIPESAASSETSGNNCSERNLGESENAREVHEASSVKQEKKPGRIQRFRSYVSSAFTCCVPSAKQLDVPFSFENPVYETTTIEDLLISVEWTTVNDDNCEHDEVSQCDSYIELNRGDLGNTDPGSDGGSKDFDKLRGNSNGHHTDKSIDTQNEDVAEKEPTSSSGSEPGRRASSGKNTNKLKRSLSWTQGIDSFWDGCTRFKREGLFSCGLLRTTNLELREQRLAEQQKGKEERKRKEKEEKFGPAKYGYDEDTPLDVYIFNESLWPECKIFTEDGYEKLWDFDNRYDYTRKSCDTETDQEVESDGESCGDYDSESNEEEEDPDKPIKKMSPKKVPRMINRSLSWAMQLNKSDMKVDDGMKSCGILSQPKAKSDRENNRV